MITYRSVAASAAQSKAAHPERFCPEQRCLWNTSGQGGASASMSPVLSAGGSSVVTRAVSVVMERSPGGGHGWNIQIDGQGRFLFCTPTEALAFAMRKLGLLGAGPEERERVGSLLVRELGRLRRAECTAEVPVREERRAA